MEWTTDVAFSNVRGNVISSSVDVDKMIKDVLTQGTPTAISKNQIM